MRIFRRGDLAGAGCGVLAAAAGVAVAELGATLLRPESSPLIGIGSTVIDLTPTPVKEYAVRTVGTYDKPLLLAGIGAVLVLVAASLGVLGQRRLRLAQAGFGVLGLVAAATVWTRPAAQPFDAVPSLLAGLVTAPILGILLHRLPRVPSSAAGPSPADRRRFLIAAGAVAGAAVAAGGVAGVARRLAAASSTRTREAIRLPAPTQPAGPRTTRPGFYTPVDEFYRVDTALTVPRLDVDRWRLRIHGLVGQPITLDFDELLSRGLIERDITLNCVSNEVGGPYIGTTRWLGIPLAPMLREAGVDADADQVVARSADGMTLGTPTATLLDGRDAMLAVGMDGRPLPPEHGFPVRMLTPGLYGYAGSCKWITELELARFADFDAYWVRRRWARDAPVKTGSRIDRPAAFATVAPGDVTVAGVAWAQGRGISAVEVQVDDGQWETAELLPTSTKDTWVQWRHQWHATTRGGHTLRVRATDGTGRTQPEPRTTPFPDGATGWHTLAVTVSD